MSIPGLSVGDLAKQRDARWHLERGVWRYRNPDGSEVVPMYRPLEATVTSTTEDDRGLPFLNAGNDPDSHAEWRKLNLGTDC